MTWEIALIGSVVLVVLGLFYLVGIFDKKEHALFSLFLFFIGLFLIVINFNMDANILLANNATINSTSAYDNLEGNINTAYWVGIIVIFVSLMYWFVYILKKSLEALAGKKKNMTEGDDDD